MGDPRHGAEIIVRLATDPDFARVTGGHFAARSADPLDCPPPGHDEAEQRALWAATSEIIEEFRTRKVSEDLA